MEQLISLQQTWIRLLSGDANGSLIAVIHPHHDELYQSASAVRRRSIAALSEQYQRLLQAAPLSSAGVPASKTSSRPLRIPRSPTRGPPNCFSKVVGSASDCIKFTCKSCGWFRRFEIRTCEVFPFDQHGNIMNRQCFLDKFHFRAGDRPCWRCFICKGDGFNNGFRRLSKIGEHIFLEHTIDEICDCRTCGNITATSAMRKALACFLARQRGRTTNMYSNRYLDALERMVSQG
jgi:hypothetical protein